MLEPIESPICFMMYLFRGPSRQKTMMLIGKAVPYTLINLVFIFCTAEYKSGRKLHVFASQRVANAHFSTESSWSTRGERRDDLKNCQKLSNPYDYGQWC